MKKKIYQTPETEVLGLCVESLILAGTNEFDPNAPVIITPGTMPDPQNPPAPV
jgi:hypothetical protein